MWVSHDLITFGSEVPSLCPEPEKAFDLPGRRSEDDAIFKPFFNFSFSLSIFIRQTPFTTNN